MDSHRTAADACWTGSPASAIGSALSGCQAMLRTSIPLSRRGATSNPRSWQTSAPTPLATCRMPPKTACTASAATPHFASHFSATPVYAYDPPQPAIARESLIGAHLDGADLRAADLRKADLRGVFLEA